VRMVASSSSPIKRLYPATSALRIAANLRVIPGVALGVGSSLEAMRTGPSVVVDRRRRVELAMPGGQLHAAIALDNNYPADHLESDPFDRWQLGWNNLNQKTPRVSRPPATTVGAIVPAGQRLPD